MRAINPTRAPYAEALSHTVPAHRSPGTPIPVCPFGPQSCPTPPGERRATKARQHKDHVDLDGTIPHDDGFKGPKAVVATVPAMVNRV